VRTGRTRAAWITVAAVALTGALWVPLAQGSDDVPPGDIANPTSTITTTLVPEYVIDHALAASMPATRMPAMQVTETLPPPSTVATAPGDSLEIPSGSGSGRRVVYSKSIMRVWIIEADETLYHTHRVSGLESQPNPGTYTVWSRSEHTCSRATPSICMRFMVRFAFSRRGDNIGFHEIPRRNGVPLQDLSQLGLALSGGCIRQSTDDSIVMWNWASLGTVVVVLP